MKKREVFENFKDDVFKTCFYMVNNYQDAEDLTQDVFIKAFDKDIDSIENMKAWLIKISINTSKNYLKRKNRFNLFENLTHLVSNLNVEKEISNSETKDELVSLINTLSPKLREAIILRYVHQMKVEEIAKTLGIPVGTVKSRIHKGISNMKHKTNSKYAQQLMEGNLDEY
ncbi:RNA polymerase sigma factor [Alkalihalobacterium chitinilyticum]|uniref:RNA polymerase sigma factor n=1 Tax=Alkalihalobacterium chitinilyticum TaxID=2980103 RepID=A0ABT5VH87_9BACI|nr:RNA polymerase sigma factor [Alkalihalobacterium chitinilyticum]MDE5414813.1 RNA polymerase sigma factor [Alkalihalobacterium chitinilyticum]